jgi:hypothetical protein
MKMPTSECAKVLKACLAQFVLVDTCGNPVTGASSKLTTKGFVSIGATAQIETGDDITLKNACGELEIDEKDDDEFKRYDLEIELVQIDPEGLSLISSARALHDADDNVKGFANGRNNDAVDFSLEVWTKVAGQACSVSGDPLWFYVAFPHVANGVLTDFTMEDGPLTLKVTAHTKDTGELWLTGPSGVLDEDDPAITTDHVIGFITDVQPPDAVCGLQAYAAA